MAQHRRSLDIQKDTGGFIEFIPLGFIHSQTELFRGGRARAGRSGPRGSDRVMTICDLIFQNFGCRSRMLLNPASFDPGRNSSKSCRPVWPPGVNDFLLY